MSNSPPMSIVCFSAVFFPFVSILSGYFLIERTFMSLALRDAVEVEARVTSYFEVLDGTGKRKRLRFTVNYEYEYLGETYREVARSLSVFSDDKRNHELREKLWNAKITGEKVSCFVDPDAPRRSVFSRECSSFHLLVMAIFSISFGWVSIQILSELVRRIQANGKNSRHHS